MLNSNYERRLLRQCSDNSASYSLEARPISAAMPPSGVFPGSSSVLPPLMAPPAKKRRISVMSEAPRHRNIGDRFIPTRAGNNWQTKFAMITETDHSGLSTKKVPENGRGSCDGSLYSCLLQNELLGASTEGVKGQCDERRTLAPLNGRNLFQYTLPDTSRNRSGVEMSPLACYSMSAVSTKSQQLLKTARQATWKISPKPFKVLDAPELRDCFCLSLVDWSSQNVLSVGLGSCAYLWSASTTQARVLFDLSGDNNSITSVAWNERGNLLAVGTEYGSVEVWDVEASKLIRRMRDRSRRVGALTWNRDLVTSGNWDGLILERDTRTPCLVADRKLAGHERKVCGLKWSPCNQYLASGGSDHRVLVWDSRSLSPVQNYTKHLADVKAIAWSPQHRGLLATGGGGASDPCIRIWNSFTGHSVQCVNTGSPVSNVAWSRDSCELVSTHDILENHVVIWRYPGLKDLASLTDHSSGVHYMAVSPDGQAIVTGGGDETLRFWNVFSNKRRSQKENKSSVSLFTSI